MLGGARRHLEILELELADRYFWNLAFGASRKGKLAFGDSAELYLIDPRITIEMLQKSVFVGHPRGRPSSSGGRPEKPPPSRLRKTSRKPQTPEEKNI